MIKIEKIKVEAVPDYDHDITDYVGRFSDSPDSKPNEGKAIDLDAEENIGKFPRSRNSFRYFIAANPGNEDAGLNYARRVEEGFVSFYGVRATAEVRTSEDGNTWLCNEIESGGIWGIDCDGGAESRAYLRENGENEVDELKKTLAQFGLTEDQINAAPVEYGDEF